jgi:mannan endo-1,4-beta-mannosidase
VFEANKEVLFFEHPESGMKDNFVTIRFHAKRIKRAKHVVLLFTSIFTIYFLTASCGTEGRSNLIKNQSEEDKSAGTSQPQSILLERFDARSREASSQVESCRLHHGGTGDVFSCGKQLCRKKGGYDDDRSNWCSIESFKVDGDKLYDANGNIFEIRGVNNAFAWYGDTASSALRSIATLGFNSVRVVWESEKKPYDLKRVIDKVLSYQLIPIIEFHDASGSCSSNDLLRLVDAWTDKEKYAGILKGLEGKVILNIANEWGCHQVSSETWRDTYETAIERMRAAELNHTLMIDSRNWAQDPEAVLSYGNHLVDRDPLRNVMFSIHTYEMWRTQNPYRYDITSFLERSKQKKLAVAIGEFAYKHDFYPINKGRPICIDPIDVEVQKQLIQDVYGKDYELRGDEFNIDFLGIMTKSHQYGAGYIAWSWRGNTSAPDPQANCKLAYLDIANKWDIGEGKDLDTEQLSWWGCKLVKNLQAKPATIFPNPSSPQRSFKDLVCDTAETTPDCQQFNGGYGDAFPCFDGKSCKKRNNNWSDTDPSNWCVNVR